jgi:hypothetical protein
VFGRFGNVLKNYKGIRNLYTLLTGKKFIVFSCESPIYIYMFFLILFL